VRVEGEREIGKKDDFNYVSADTAYWLTTELFSNCTALNIVRCT